MTNHIYTHLDRDEHVGDEGRRYCATENTIEYQGRQVLYQYVDSHGVTFCTGNYVPYVGSINVKGYVVRWKFGTDEDGNALSEVEPITNKEEQQEISARLWPGHSPRVNFF